MLILVWLMMRPTIAVGEGVELMFENDPDPKVSRPRVQFFINRCAAQYPMLIAGTTQPSPSSKTIDEALPQLVNFGAYPTTISKCGTTGHDLQQTHWELRGHPQD